MIELLDTWLWAAFVVVGLLMILLELFIGVETGFDLVMLGSALVLGGLLTSFVDSWLATAICASLFCALYVGIGRRYIRAKMKLGATKTNVDAIIGKSGIVTRSIGENTSGRVRVGNEEWRAMSGGNIDIEEGATIMVLEVTGVTLIVAEEDWKWKLKL
ncbi:MAG: NfeD family protein [Euryarchaeota archaeon]|nr:NfeD family protein [Euryarchaeota archaeon]